MTDLDALARRAVDSVLLLVGRAISFATKVTLVTAPICIVSFLLGIAVFSDGMRTVWIVLGGLFLLIAVGGAIRAIWRLWSLRRHSRDLTTELASYLGRDEQTRRTVVETVEAGEQSDTSVIVWSRQFGTIDPGDASGQYRRLSGAVRAVATFPLHMLATVMITGVFGFLGVIFLAALAL